MHTNYARVVEKQMPLPFSSLEGYFSIGTIAQSNTNQDEQDNNHGFKARQKHVFHMQSDYNRVMDGYN
jgi:hypothetical protein